MGNFEFLEIEIPFLFRSLIVVWERIVGVREKTHQNGETKRRGKRGAQSLCVIEKKTKKKEEKHVSKNLRDQFKPV